MIAGTKAHKKKRYLEKLTGKIRDLDKVKVRKLNESPRDLVKPAGEMELGKALVKPAFQKLAPIQFKKTNIKEAVISGINSRSLEKEQIQKLILENSKKEFKSCIKEVSNLENQYQREMEEIWKTSESHFQAQETVTKTQEFFCKQFKINQARATIKQEFLNQLDE